MSTCLNDVIDILLTVENAVDVLETGRKFVPNSRKLKINNQVAFQRFVLAEIERRYPVRKQSSILSLDILSIGHFRYWPQWRSMPWSFESKKRCSAMHVATQSQYEKLTPGRLFLSRHARAAALTTPAQKSFDMIMDFVSAVVCAETND